MITIIYSDCGIAMEEVFAFADKIRKMVGIETRKSVATETIENVIKNDRAALRVAITLSVAIIEKKNLLKDIRPEDGYVINELRDPGEYNHNGNIYLECCGVTSIDMESYEGNIVAFIVKELNRTHDISYLKIVEYMENACLESPMALRLTSIMTTNALVR